MHQSSVLDLLLILLWHFKTIFQKSTIYIPSYSPASPSHYMVTCQATSFLRTSTLSFSASFFLLKMKQLYSYLILFRSNHNRNPVSTNKVKENLTLRREEIYYNKQNKLTPNDSSCSTGKKKKRIGKYLEIESEQQCFSFYFSPLEELIIKRKLKSLSFEISFGEWITVKMCR